jgi:hypothetical protein
MLCEDLEVLQQEMLCEDLEVLQQEMLREDLEVLQQEMLCETSILSLKYLSGCTFVMR